MQNILLELDASRTGTESDPDPIGSRQRSRSNTLDRELERQRTANEGGLISVAVPVQVGIGSMRLTSASAPRAALKESIPMAGLAPQQQQATSSSPQGVQNRGRSTETAFRENSFSHSAEQSPAPALASGGQFRAAVGDAHPSNTRARPRSVSDMRSTSGELALATADGGVGVGAQQHRYTKKDSGISAASGPGSGPAPRAMRPSILKRSRSSNVNPHHSPTHLQATSTQHSSSSSEDLFALPRPGFVSGAVNTHVPEWRPPGPLESASARSFPDLSSSDRGAGAGSVSERGGYGYRERATSITRSIRESYGHGYGSEALAPDTVAERASNTSLNAIHTYGQAPRLDAEPSALRSSSQSLNSAYPYQSERAMKDRSTYYDADYYANISRPKSPYRSTGVLLVTPERSSALVAVAGAPPPRPLSRLNAAIADSSTSADSSPYRPAQPTVPPNPEPKAPTNYARPGQPPSLGATVSSGLLLESARNRISGAYAYSTPHGDPRSAAEATSQSARDSAVLAPSSSVLQHQFQQQQPQWTNSAPSNASYSHWQPPVLPLAPSQAPQVQTHTSGLGMSIRAEPQPAQIIPSAPSNATYWNPHAGPPPRSATLPTALQAAPTPNSTLKPTLAAGADVFVSRPILQRAATPSTAMAFSFTPGIYAPQATRFTFPDVPAQLVQQQMGNQSAFNPLSPESQLQSGIRPGEVQLQMAGNPMQHSFQMALNNEQISSSPYGGTGMSRLLPRDSFASPQSLQLPTQFQELQASDQYQSSPYSVSSPFAARPEAPLRLDQHAPFVASAVNNQNYQSMTGGATPPNHLSWSAAPFASVVTQNGEQCTPPLRGAPIVRFTSPSSSAPMAGRFDTRAQSAQNAPTHTTPAACRIAPQPQLQFQSQQIRPIVHVNAHTIPIANRLHSNLSAIRPNANALHHQSHMQQEQQRRAGAGFGLASGPGVERAQTQSVTLHRRHSPHAGAGAGAGASPLVSTSDVSRQQHHSPRSHVAHAAGHLGASTHGAPGARILTRTYTIMYS